MTKEQALYQYLLRFADTSLILGQRLAEWCSRGPILEEDLALTNISLDYFGQAEAFYTIALKLGNKSGSADDLAFKRSEREYYNYLLAEVENGDYAKTMMKVYLLSVFLEKIYQALGQSTQEDFKVLAQKSLKEIMYHKRHCSAWLFRLSHGTAESASRVQKAMEELWPYTEDLFATDQCDELLLHEIHYNMKDIQQAWLSEVHEHLHACGFVLPENGYMIQGGIAQQHTEALGHILCEMQFLQRAHPGATW